MKSTYPVAVLYSLLSASSSGRSNAISASYRSAGFRTSVETHRTITRRNRIRSARGAGKQQRIQHSNRVSRFYSQNITIIGFLSKTVAFPYKPL